MNDNVGKISPVEIENNGDKKLDMSESEANIASVRLLETKAEEARKALEIEANVKKTPEERQQEINKILESLK